MPSRLFVFLFLISNTSFGQTYNQVLEKAKSQTVIVVAALKPDPTGKPRNSVGCGFILNGEFVATCYHVIADRKEKYLKSNSIYVLYNPHSVKNKIRYDTVYADLNYKASKNQYDFAKHKFDSTDHTTDFIVLKLKKKLVSYKLDYNVDTLPPGTQLTALGVFSTKNETTTFISRQYSVLKVQFYYNMSEGKFICFTGNVVDGYSGSPVYNTNGKIVGMNQFGMREFPKFFVDLLKQDTYSEIQEAYKQGQSLNYAIPIGTLIDRYLKGYLNP